MRKRKEEMLKKKRRLSLSGQQSISLMHYIGTKTQCKNVYFIFKFINEL